MPNENPLDNAACGLLEVAADGQIAAANSAFAQIVDRDQSALLGMRIQELLTRGSALFYETQFSPSLLLRGGLEEISFELLRSSGERVPVFVNAVLRRPDADREPRVFLAVFAARQRHRYEAELLRSRKEAEQLAEVVRRSSDAIVRLSADARIESWNTGAQQIFGYATSEAVGNPFSLLFAGDAFQELGTFSELKRGKDVNLETVGKTKQEQPVDVSVSLTPHLEAPGTLVGFSAIIRDMTKQKVAERNLLQAEKLASVGRLASSIAHEINNPLEAVTNLLYILNSRITDEDTKQLVQTAEEELARVSQIANYTLRFHKQSTDQIEVDLSMVVKGVLGVYRGRLQNSGIQIVDESSDCGPLLCYENDLRQVLLNLISNAFDAMRSGGKITIRCRELDRSGVKSFRIVVADTGTGMDQPTLERLFEPFFSTKGIGGTGLGLWISRDLILRNGGSIKVRSSQRANHSGTTFVLSFPRIDPTPFRSLTDN
ncbi:ATP-binding protein [Tunturiibacter psychrotolerans]|uniref:ATP-binding protein n=1 Tax=Tunturiibacter psychrotolerans TaxID=3069686 RepID=UPI003D1B20C8